MKNLLVPIEMHAGIDNIFGFASRFAARHDSRIESVAMGPDLPDLIAFDTPIAWTAIDQGALKDMARDARTHFERLVSASPQSQAWNWRSDTLMGDRAVGAYGRIFDLIILGRPAADRGGPRLASVEAGLFESGRPVLLVPPDAPLTVGETIVIAWNQSIETSRATALAMPLLRAAKRVIVLTIDEFRVEGPTGAQLAANLVVNGVVAEAASRAAAGKTHGEALLHHAAQLGADLMVKGAYTQSRWRQMIFGGATSHIMAKAALPVFMSG